MDLKEIISEVRKGWSAYRSLGKVSELHSEYSQVVHLFPNILRGLIKDRPYRVQGSTGKGNITAAPWIATFDPSITTGATNGFYLVYLYSVDLERLYLSIAFGTTQFQNYFRRVRERHEKMRSAARYLQQLLDDPNSFDLNELNLTRLATDRLHFDYQAANIASVEYNLNDLPSGAQLEADYFRLLGAYGRLVRNPLLPSIERLLEAEIDAPPVSLLPTVKDFTPRPPKISNASGKGGPRYSPESKKIGDRGELVAFEYEKAKLIILGHDPKIVRWLAREGETPGWDISSLDLDGSPLHIEVKSYVGSSFSMLAVTANEWSAAQRLGNRYCFYVITDVMKSRPMIEVIRNPVALSDSGALKLKVASWNIML